MDSNVSKETNSHKFFKIPVNPEKQTVSIKKLIKQLLLSLCDLYQQEFNVEIEPKFAIAIAEPKIALANLKTKYFWELNNGFQTLLEPQFVPIRYSCPLALALASYWQIPVAMVSQNFKSLLIAQQNNLAESSSWLFKIEILSSGWFNIYLNSNNLSAWLKRSFLLIKKNAINNQNLLTVSKICDQEQTSDKIFFLQYVHARCCSWLRLGAQAKLITLEDNLSLKGYYLLNPQSISWLDRHGSLWLNEASAHNLLCRLLIITDSFVGNFAAQDWIKLASSFGLATLVFQSDCRFLGGVTAPKAIARLGLIALVQYWLQRILQEKLHVAAPIEL